MATIPEEIVNILNRLSPDKQHQVLDYIRILEHTAPHLPVGAPISNLLRFAGSLSQETADEMAQAIETYCQTPLAKAEGLADCPCDSVAQGHPRLAV